ncbi:MAG TPA: hypothetical protein VEY92_01560 [Pseudoxanthomonas sp.]|nr:hypothetical protein [Pseudoxanthomonas sp.]
MKRRELVARVLLAGTGFEARLEFPRTARDKRAIGAAITSSMAVRNLARVLGFKPGFDYRYEGKAADGVGTVWSIVQL